MPLVDEICDRVGIIFDGKLHGDAPPRTILEARHAKTLDEVFFQLAAESEGSN
jgi:sodium transport system ATP-binding protein